MNRHLHRLYWLLPLLLHAPHAQAWGLMTHLYFAHSLLWAMPLLDPRLQAAIRRFPELVMAGSCLPDLAVVSPLFRHTHQWRHAHHMLQSAADEQELALAIGYASHLYVDVIAHNHFVPAHEALWMENAMATHIACEWAMDAHLTPLLDTAPHQLLRQHHRLLSDYAARHFACSQPQAASALHKLAFWDRLLRLARIPQLIYHSARCLDRRTRQHFIYYIARTQTAMSGIGKVLQGGRPDWEPELTHLSLAELSHWRERCRNNLHGLHPDPIRYFHGEAQQVE